jgi:hypothetical protein
MGREIENQFKLFYFIFRRLEYIRVDIETQFKLIFYLNVFYYLAIEIRLVARRERGSIQLN